MSTENEQAGSFSDYDVSAVRGDPAAIAIKGMPPSKLADTLRALEQLRTGFKQWWKSPKQIEVLRKEVAELALAYGKLQNAQAALAIQADNYQQFLRLAGDVSKLRAFFLEHYNRDIREAEELNTPLLDLAKRIMLEYKRGIRKPE
jgi:hypothetical protein